MEGETGDNMKAILDKILSIPCSVPALKAMELIKYQNKLTNEEIELIKDQWKFTSPNICIDNFLNGRI